MKFYAVTVLPFGLSSIPYVFTKILKAGVNLKFAQKLSFLFSSEFAALGI